MSRLSCAQRLDDFRVVRESALGVFREDHHAIRNDIENAATAPREVSFEAKRLGNIGRQTDSPGLIASRTAVDDREMHGVDPR